MLIAVLVAILVVGPPLTLWILRRAAVPRTLKGYLNHGRASRGPLPGQDELARYMARREAALEAHREAEPRSEEDEAELARDEAADAAREDK
jgi:hypothetical protein